MVRVNFVEGQGQLRWDAGCTHVLRSCLYTCKLGWQSEQVN